MMIEYSQKALELAQYRRLEGRSWFARIPGFEGVWANASTVEAARTELVEVLEEWVMLKLRDGDPLPVVSGIELKITTAAAG
jgi:predicted RNase H-like HicB family nuclease